MKSFNDPSLSLELLRKIREAMAGLPVLRFMEVCGTHTMAIGRFGLRRLLPENLTLISGPGCPVCVTPAELIDNAARLALQSGVTLATYGDMVRVPGVDTSLEEARARGARIRILTSPAEILEFKEETVFLAVGFETTTAPIAAVMDRIIMENRTNLSLYTSLKVVPPALRLLRAMEGMAIDGFLLPGHVSTIIGSGAYDGLDLPSVIAGFEMVDILEALLRLIENRKKGVVAVENAYTRVVTPGGNLKAKALMERYFEPCDQLWRGLGPLPGCSLRLRPGYSCFDAEKKYALSPLSDRMPPGCSCGEVLKGCFTPKQCPLFGKGCTPDAPKGPCMVSSEGSCAAYFRYEREVA